MSNTTRLARPTQGLTIEPRRDNVRLGKDILELLSTALYVDPLVVYREYVQNAADSIDTARAMGLYEANDDGRVAITIDPKTRSLRIRDTGAGLAPDVFAERMLALGGSAKRGTQARGFRGVGRLAGLGHAQDLAFRSRTPGQADVSVAHWDGRRLKAALTDVTFDGDVADLIASIVRIERRPARDDEPPHFFEVELSRVVRGRSDKLLSPEDVADYLSEVAPVPFHTDFSFGEQIRERLADAWGYAEIEIRINGGPALTRPHRDAVEVGGRLSPFTEIDIVEVPSQDVEGGLAAIGWFLHHGYEGALTVGTRVKGIRLRAGNLQVGDGTILENIFKDPRFNSWSVGEVHLLDPRITPNGRRDQFEANIHYANLQNHLAPSASKIIDRCRTNSARRSRLRELELIKSDVEQQLELIEQGTLKEAARDARIASIGLALEKMGRLAASPMVGSIIKVEEQMTALKVRLEAVRSWEGAIDPLAHLPPEDQAFYRRLTSVIYAHAVNRSAAKALIDRIIEQEIHGSMQSI